MYIVYHGNSVIVSGIDQSYEILWLLILFEQQCSATRAGHLEARYMTGHFLQPEVYLLLLVS